MRVKRRGHRQNALTDAQAFDLLCGRSGAFPTEMERQQAWNTHGEALMAADPRTVPIAHRQYDLGKPEATRCR